MKNNIEISDRVQEIYLITKNEILNAESDISDYIPILYCLQQIEDYEAMAGIKKAVAEYGIVLIVPENEDELDAYMKKIRNK